MDGAKFTALERKTLMALLYGDPSSAQHREFTADQALTALEECVTAYREGEALPPHPHPTLGKSRALIRDVLAALRRLENGADSDTVHAVRPAMGALRMALEDRAIVLKVWQEQPNLGKDCPDQHPFRKPDARGERKRVLCGCVATVWNAAANKPGDVMALRRFATTALNAASIEHPGMEHPERLDDWLNTPVQPMTPEVNAEAAREVRTLLKR